MVRESEHVPVEEPFEASFTPVVGAYFLTAATALVINIVLRKVTLAPVAEVLIALLPIAGLWLLGARYFAFLRQADELQRLVHTRAAAFLSLTLLGYVILLGAALPSGKIHSEDLNSVWILLWLCYLGFLKMQRKQFE